MATNSKIGKSYPSPRSVKEEEIILHLPYKPASRKRSWIDVQQIETEHWEVIDKIATILYEKGKNWTEKSIQFARSVLDFVVDHEFMSWKQYDSIMGMMSIKEFKELYNKNQQVLRLAHRQGLMTLKSGGATITVRSGVIKMDGVLGEMFRQAKTDRDFDRLYKIVWGEDRFPDDAEDTGCVYRYRDDGSRYEYEMDEDEADDFFDDMTADMYGYDQLAAEFGL